MFLELKFFEHFSFLDRNFFKNMDSMIDFVSGTLGGIATVYTGQPLDTIKVKMQMFPDLYKSAFRCGVETFKKDGIYRGLYAGTVPALAANVSGKNIRNN